MSRLGLYGGPWRPRSDGGITRPDPIAIETPIPAMNWQLGQAIAPVDLQSYLNTNADTFVLQSGTLPNGLSIDGNGVISGTPTENVTGTVVYLATDTFYNESVLITVEFDSFEYYVIIALPNSVKDGVSGNAEGTQDFQYLILKEDDQTWLEMTTDANGGIRLPATGLADGDEVVLVVRGKDNDVRVGANRLTVQAD